MKIELELTDQEANLIHTFIRRAIYEQFYRNMAEAGDTKEEAEHIKQFTLWKKSETP